MVIVKLFCFLLFFSAKNIAKEQTGTVEEYINNKIEVINTETTELIEHDVIKLKEPAASLACDKTNGDKIRIIRDIDGYFFFLSVNELLAVKVNTNNVAELFFIGTLLDIEATDSIIDIQMEKWKSLYMIIIQQSSRLKIYLVKFDISDSPDINHIQKININSIYDKFKVFRKGNDVIMIIYHINENTPNELIFYTWQNSYFSKDATEQADLPNKSDMFIFNENEDETLILSIGYGLGNQSTQVAVFRHDQEAKRWLKLQKMRFKKDYIEHFSIHGKLYLIGCYTESFCAIYKWSGSVFQRHLKISSSVFEIIKSVYSRHNIIIVENFQNKLSLYSTSNIISQPGITLPKSSDVSQYTIYRSQEGYLYFIEVAKNETSIRMSFYQMSIIDASIDESRSNVKEIDPIECVIKLKASMKNRVASVKSSERNAKALKSNSGKLDISKKKILNAKYVNLKNSNVATLKMPYNVSVLTKELLEQIVSSNIRLEKIKQTLNDGSTWKSHERANENFENESGSINVQNLIYNGNQVIFKDIMRKSQPILSFNDQIRLANITVNKLDVISSQINKIQLNRLLNATSTKSVKGIKNILTLKIEEGKISETINNVPLTFLNSTENKLKQARKIDFNGDINVEHLNVRILNGFDVSKLMNDLYLKDSKTVIKGDLFVRSFFNVDNLFANHVKSIPINNFLTTTSDQQIDSNLMILRFHATIINSKTVNGEDTSNFALSYEKNVIQIPTKLMFLNVRENINIQDSDVEGGYGKSIQNFVRTIKRHVIGTDASDLAQIYNGKVVIQGSLFLKDLNTFSPKTKIIVNDHQIPLNITEYYWTKSTHQIIHVDNFEITNNTTISGIVLENLNNHPLKNYLRIDISNDLNSGVILRFEDVIVEGHINGHQKNHPSLLLQLSQNVIRIDEPTATISSSIEFRNKLVIKNLYTNSINSIPASSLVHKHLHLVYFESPKIIQNMEINKDLIVDNGVSVVNYNNVNLQKFWNEAVRIDKPIMLDSLKLKSFSVYNLSVINFEQHDFNKMVKNLEEELDFSKESNKAKRSIRIHGDATFNANIFIDLLNGDLDFNEFVSLLAYKNGEAQEIGGRKIFQKGLTVTEHLESKSLNSFSTDRLLHQSLSRGDKQTLVEHIFVKNLRVNELHTNKLNDISWNQLIDKNTLNLPLKINLILDELEIEDLYTNSATMDFTEMIKIIQFPKRLNWNSITSISECNIQFGMDTYLDMLIAHGVVKSAISQEITAKVIIEQPFYMKNVRKKDYVVNTRSSSADIKYLNDDSVKDYSPLEIVRGRKVVSSGLRFDANNLYIGPKCNFYSTFVNNVNVFELNKSIYRKGQILSSIKKFNNLEIGELIIENGLLNGIDLESIVKISQDNVKLPNMNFDSLEMENLKTFSFNTYSLLYFLKSRMQKSGLDSQIVSSYLTFDSIRFDNDTEIVAINNVYLNDAIYHKSDQLQIIDGHKIVTGNVITKGPAHIGTINTVDLIEFHKNTIDIKQEYRTDAPFKLSQVELKNGIHITKNINDRNIDELLSSNAHSPKLNDLMTLITNVTKQISEIDHQKSVKRKRKRMLYIDVDENIDFKYKMPRSNDGNECLARNEIDFKPYSKGVMISQKSELEITVELPSVRFKLNPNFDCENDDVSNRKIDIWWTYPNGKERSEGNYFQNFTFNKKIMNVKFMESSDNRVLIALLLTNEKSSEIICLRLDNSTHEIVYGHTPFVGYYETIKMELVESIDKSHYLVVSSFNKNTENDKIFIYKYDLTKGLFVQSQKPFAGGNFDIILSIKLQLFKAFRGKTFLLFAKTNGRQIKIYHRKDETGEFVFQRMIDDFKDSIVEVLVLYIGDKPFIIVSQKSGLFCLYEWRGIESWKSKYCGRFENIHQMKTFEYLNRQHLFLASMAQNSTPSINALTIYRQGD